MDLNQIQVVIISTIGLLAFLTIFFIIRNLLSYQKKRVEQENREITHVGFVVDTFHDLVTKLKEKERELESLRNMAEDRASSVELYNENIIQSVPSGVVSFDCSQRITRMNAAAAKILGLGEDISGRSCEEVFRSPINEMIMGRRVLEREETSYTTDSGKRLWIGLTLSPLRDGKNETIGQLLVFTDLTELKAFQSQKELRDRLDTLGEMSAGIAHELRNPMGVISGYTKMLSKKVEDPLKPAVDAISKEIDGMNRIITDFLAFARPVEPVLSDLDLSSLFRECIGIATGGRTGIEFSADLECLPVIRADEVMMRQAISNLLNNAVEAMPDGGVVGISCIRNENLTITISDTGHGIPENIMDKIFLPFYTTKERGTGLGLAIVHKIIVSHGGTVHAVSTSEGTSFVILFPKEIIADS